MGRKSTRDNKTVYQLAREKQGLTLEEAGDRIDGLSAERITRIESGSCRVQPEDIMLMAEGYLAPELCNYYCTHECAIGKATMQVLEQKPFSQIVIETLNSLNKVSKHKDRLLEIVEDGRLTRDEYEDFMVIKANLDKIAASVNELQLWIAGQIAEGKIDPKAFEK